MGSSTDATRRLTLTMTVLSASMTVMTRTWMSWSWRWGRCAGQHSSFSHGTCLSMQLTVSYHSSNYANVELKGRADRPQILTDFINYMLGLNAATWVQKDDFLTSGEIKNIWSLGSQPPSLLVVVPSRSGGAAQSSGGGGGQGVSGSATSSSQHGSRGRGRGRGKACNDNQAARPSTPMAAPLHRLRSRQDIWAQFCRHYMATVPTLRWYVRCCHGYEVDSQCEVYNGNLPRVQPR